MPRWHDVACYNPDIVVRDKIPHCRNCNRSPNINTLVKNATTPNSFSQAPKDEPLGKLNLYWPSSVPYNGTTRTSASKPRNNGQRQPKPSPVYPRRLSSDEFRLLRLQPSNNVNDPLWAELEEYPLQRCPEYEAASYTWATEDGDASLSRPIFLGPYWDFQFQTRNCWSMLQAMRLPGKGSRMVWIDAICINQDDIEERDSQVSKMSQIYTGCRRVFLYLGPDITAPLGNRHPFRRELTAYSTEEAEAAKADGFSLLNLLDLLERRYFTRVWVIQELVLARQVVIQTRDVEFWMDASTIQSLDLQEVKAALWIQRVAQKQFQHADIYKVLRETRISRCGDLRDKVFGLLALCGEDDPSQVLKANYELSCVHTFIGLFSHILLNLKHIDVLLHASGQSAWNRYPSWVPDWTASGPEWLFPYPQQDGMGVIKKSAQPSPDFEFCPVTLHPDRLKQEIIRQPFNGWEERMSPSHSVWHEGATVDAATGMISMDLVLLLTFRSAPKPVSRSRGLIVFALQGETATMFLASDGRLEDQVMAGDHLFLCIRNNAPATFRLLACGDALGFNIPSNSTCLQALELQESGSESESESESDSPKIELYPGDLQISLFQCLEVLVLKTFIIIDANNLEKVFLLLERQGHLKEMAEDPEAAYDDTDEATNASNKKLAQESCLLPAFQGILNESRGLTPGFLESYVGCLDESLCAREQDDYVFINLADHQSLHEESVYEKLEGGPTSSKPFGFRYRASKLELKRVMTKTWIFQYLECLTFAAKLTGECELDILRRGPRDEDRVVFHSQWPAEIMESFEIDGKTQRVNIA